MIKTIKVQLCPNNKQQTKLFQSASVARFAYNWALDYQNKNYKNGGKFISHYYLRKLFTQLKTQDEYQWINDYSNNVTKQAIIDCCGAFEKFFKGLAKHPKFKSRHHSKPSFYVDTAKIKFKDGKVKLEKLTTSRKVNKQLFNWVRLAEPNRIPENAKYSNPRVTFDGLNWWLSVGIECDERYVTPKNDGIGIDLGVKDLAICSDANTYKNINKSMKVRKLNKKKRRLQRKASRKYLMNKKGERYCKTRNVVKSQRQLLKLSHRLTNIRHNYLNQTTTEIVNREPKFIVLEDLNVKGMLKNKHLAKAVQEQCFYEFHRQLEYKCQEKHIELRVADRFYPSSKICSCCGNIKKDLKLKDRIYHCEVCGNTIDRDFQASVNLKNCTDYRVA
jgi:putative transposase